MRDLGSIYLEIVFSSKAPSGRINSFCLPKLLGLRERHELFLLSRPEAYSFYVVTILLLVTAVN